MRAHRGAGGDHGGADDYGVGNRGIPVGGRRGPVGDQFDIDQ